MATDSEVLSGIAEEAFDLDLNNDEIATLRKYAAIAKAIEAGTWKLVPVEPVAEMLHPIARSEWPEDWEAGKALQRLRGTDVVYPKTEIECAVGQYQRCIAAAPQFQEE